MSFELELENTKLYTSLVVDEWTPPDTFKKNIKGGLSTKLESMLKQI